MEAWLPKWRTPNIAETEKLTTQKKKDEAKMHIAQLAKKRQKETTTAKVQAARDATQKAAEQEKAAAVAAAQEAATEVGKGQTMTSQGQEVEEVEIEEGGANPRTAST